MNRKCDMKESAFYLSNMYWVIVVGYWMIFGINLYTKAQLGNEKNWIFHYISFPSSENLIMAGLKTEKKTHKSNHSTHTSNT